MASFFNQATLIYRGQITNSNVTTGEIVDVLGATKTAISQNYGANDAIAYTVSLVNSGASALENISITDNLGAYTLGTLTVYPLEYVDGTLKYFLNGILQPTPTVTAAPELTVSGINIPAGANALLIYEARTNEYAPLEAGSVISNGVTASSDGLCGPLEATASIPVREEALPFITKFSSASQLVCNGEITYTFVIQNLGNTPTVATDDLVLRDTFNPILNISSVKLDGVEWSEGANYTYDAASGEFATLPGQITLPAASYETDSTGLVSTTPGVVILTVTGTV